MARFAFIVILLCIGNCVVPAQNVPLVDTGAIEVQLSGSATWYMGTESSDGSVTLKASRAGRSRMDLQLGTRHLSEISVNDAREPKTYVNSDSGWKQAAAHNSWVDAIWFFPSFSTVAIGRERGFMVSGTGVNRLRTQFNIAGQKPGMTRLIQVLSIADFDLDPTTQLPTRMRWVTHPDDDYAVSIPVEVRYSDYRDVNGVKVPFHIERYFNGTLQLEITVFNVVLNPGLSASDFAPSAN